MYKSFPVSFDYFLPSLLFLNIFHPLPRVFIPYLSFFLCVCVFATVFFCLCVWLESDFAIWRHTLCLPPLTSLDSPVPPQSPSPLQRYEGRSLLLLSLVHFCVAYLPYWTDTLTHAFIGARFFCGGERRGLCVLKGDNKIYNNNNNFYLTI